MPDILWDPPPSGSISAGTTAGLSVATVSGSGGTYDGSSLETLSSYRTTGWLFAVGTPHFPPQGSIGGYQGFPYFAHDGGFWNARPSSGVHDVTVVPLEDVWRYPDFQDWKSWQQCYPIPTPNDYQYTLVNGLYGVMQGAKNNTGTAVNFQGVSVPSGQSLIYASGIGPNPFGGGGSGAMQVDFSNPSHLANQSGGVPFPNPTVIEVVAGQITGNVTRALRAGCGRDYPYRVYDHLDLWFPDTLYYLYQTLPDPSVGGGSPPNPYALRKHVTIDAPEWNGRPGSNRVAWGKSDMGTLVSSVPQVAQVGVIRPAIKDEAGRSAFGVFLDTSVLEPEATNTAGGKYAVPGGCNPVWLPSGALVAIYRTRTSTSGSWSHWWRINTKSGEQSTQPTISTGVMGNWSARQAITLPTSAWCQIARGQGHIVALYNDGSVTYTPATNAFTRTVGTLYAIVALDPLCQTWSAPVTIATGVMPLAGGLCYTGECWVACYTRNSDLASLCKRSFNLTDWSGAAAVATGLVGATFPLHCYGLCHARNSVQGVWAPYADAPVPTGGGYYLSGYSADQGRHWQLPQGAVKAGSGLVMDGGATVCQEMAVLQLPGIGPAMQYSDTKFRLTTGTHVLP